MIPWIGALGADIGFVDGALYLGVVLVVSWRAVHTGADIWNTLLMPVR